MKFVLQELKLGDRVLARVEEVLSDGDIIICLGGDLLRVSNETRRNLKAGEQVSVVVKALRPLRFQLQADRSEQRRKGHLDVSV